MSLAFAFCAGPLEAQAVDSATVSFTRGSYEVKLRALPDSTIAVSASSQYGNEFFHLPADSVEALARRIDSVVSLVMPRHANGAPDVATAQASSVRRTSLIDPNPRLGFTRVADSGGELRSFGVGIVSVRMSAAEAQRLPAILRSLAAKSRRMMPPPSA